MSLIIRDKNGKVINIGAWDYMLVDVFDDEGNKTGQVVQNPLPEGAYEDDAEIITLDDGGLSAK